MNERKWGDGVVPLRDSDTQVNTTYMCEEQAREIRVSWCYLRFFILIEMGLRVGGSHAMMIDIMCINFEIGCLLGGNFRPHSY